MQKPPELATKRQLFLEKRAAGRNNKWYDIWSLIHFATGIVLGWLMPPLIAILIMVLWEPLEIFVLSPILARFSINFGYETAKNSLSDMVVDALGALIGYMLLRALVTPPFQLF